MVDPGGVRVLPAHHVHRADEPAGGAGHQETVLKLIQTKMARLCCRLVASGVINRPERHNIFNTKFTRKNFRFFVCNAVTFHSSNFEESNLK